MQLISIVQLVRLHGILAACHQMVVAHALCDVRKLSRGRALRSKRTMLSC